MPAVRRDFFLDPELRLTEQERALMTAMLHELVAAVADEIAGALPPTSRSQRDRPHGQIVAELFASGLLDIEALVALLLRRADEERIFQAARTGRDRHKPRFIQGLVANENSNVSVSAMALVLAQGRRRDRLGQVRIDFDDLDSATASQLVHLVAASLRPPAGTSAPSLAAHVDLAKAASALLARHDPERGLHAITVELVEALDESGLLQESLFGSAAEEGEAAFLAEALARRSGLGSDAAWDCLIGGTEALVFLLRAAGISRPCTAAILASIGQALGVTDPGAAISRFDQLAEAEIEGIRQWLALAPSYRSALAKLGAGNG